MSSSQAAARGAAEPLPQAIVDTLDQVIRRQRTLILVRGLLVAGAVAVASLLAVMAVDAAVTIFSPFTRWLLTGTVVAATAAAVVWFVALPIMRIPGLARMARAIETHHPELAERVSSAIELLTSSDSREVLGSEELIAQLTVEATEQVGVIKPRREVTLRPARPALAAAVAGAAVLALFWGIWPHQTSRLFVRAIAPFARVGNLGARDLEVSPGDAVLAIGDSLRISAIVRNGGAQSATLLREADGTERELEMTRLPDDNGESHFTLTLPSGEQSFRYRVLTSEKALSPSYRVTVTPRPAAVRYDVRYEYPKYLQREPVTKKDASTDLKAPVGTTLVLTAVLNKPPAKAEFLVNGRTVSAAKLGAGDDGPTATWRIAMRPKTSGKWWLKMTDRYGLASDVEKHSIKAVPDAAPKNLILREPVKTELMMRPTDSVPFVYTVEEDYGVSAVALLVRAGSGKEAPITLPLPERDESGLWSGRGVLDLAQVSVGHAKQVRVQVRVTDTRPASLKGPQHAVSETVTITLDQDAPSYADQYVDSKKAQIEKSLREALKALTAAKKQSTILVGPKFMVQMNYTNQAMSVVNSQAFRADQILHRVGEKEALPDFVEVAAGSIYVAEILVAPAQKAVKMIRLAEKKAIQKKHAKNADEFITKAIKAVNELLDLLGSEAKRVRKRRELAAEAQRLAREQASILRDAQQYHTIAKAETPLPGRPDPKLRKMRVSLEALRLAEKCRIAARVNNPGPRIMATDHKETRAPKKGTPRLSEDGDWGKRPPGSANPIIVATGPAWAPGSKGPPTGKHGPKPPNMPRVEQRAANQAQRAADKAKQSAEEQQAQESMKMAQEALQALQKAAEMLQSGQSKPGKPKPGKPGKGKPGGKPGRGAAGGGGVAGRLPEGIGSDDWLRLPSELRTRMLQSAKTRSPEEYRTLVRRYFHTLAEQSGGRK